MAKIANIPIAGEAGTGTAGGAFRVQPTPGVTKEATLADGWEIRIARGTTYGIASSTAPLRGSDAISAAHEALQRGLDLLAAEGTYSGLAVDVDREHLGWWHTDRHQVLRITSNSLLNVEVSVDVEIRRKDGTIEKPSKPGPTTWQESLRYYRQSQATDDLLDSYRNLWLAFENILSAVAPRNPGERERDWLLRGLNTIQQRFDLKQFLVARNPNVTVQFLQEQYDDARLQLFHAKASAARRLPHSLHDRHLLRTRIDQLGMCYLEIAKRFFGLARSDGVFTHGGFALAMSWMDEKCAALLSGDSRELDSGETSQSPPWSTAVSAPSFHQPIGADPGLHSSVARFDQTHLQRVPRVRRIGIKRLASSPDDEVLFFATRLSDDVSVDDLAVLETHQGCWLGNPSLPRRLFRT